MAEQAGSHRTGRRAGRETREGNGGRQAPAYPPTAPGRHAQEEPTAWGGMVGFAAVMMIVLGFYNAIIGLAALFNSEWFVATEAGLLLLDFTTWGWTLLIIGAVVLAAGFGVLAGQMWARVVGVVAASVNAVGHLLFMPAYPLWSILVIALDVVVIYALVAHGREWAATA